jgi:hypothetical protein
VPKPRALDAAAANVRADRRRKTKAPPVRLAILAAASRVRCAALHVWSGKAKPPERGKEESGLKHSIVAADLVSDEPCDDLAMTPLLLIQGDHPLRGGFD